MSEFLKVYKTSIITGALMSILFLVSCDKEAKITFEDESISTKEYAVIEVNIPKANGSGEVSKKINEAIEQFVVFALDDDANTPKRSLKEAIKQFDDEFKKFNQQIPEHLSEELPVWEALIDAEITYQSDNLVSVGMNSNVNTGAAKNRSHFEFYNFDLQTGKKLNTSDLIADEAGFKTLVKKYFDKELLTNFEDASALKNVMTDSNFSLPKTIGFNDDGIIILFDNFGDFLTETVEFTIPFSQAEDYLRY